MENGKMSFEQTAQEDLKAFERRLTEVISCYHPTTSRWRLVLGVLMLCLSVTTYSWLYDPKTQQINFLQSIWNHPLFFISSIVLVVLVMMGIHKKVMAVGIIAERARCVLGDFNMSCDDNGKLILRPRPNHNHNHHTTTTTTTTTASSRTTAHTHPHPHPHLPDQHPPLSLGATGVPL